MLGLGTGELGMTGAPYANGDGEAGPVMVAGKGTVGVGL